MAAGDPHVDYPGDGTGLSVIPLGSGRALTSRVRRVGEQYLSITTPRTGVGAPVVLAEGQLLKLAWQADDGLRAVPAEVTGLADDGLWQIRVNGAATRTQRRDAVRAPIGLPVRVVYGRTELVGSTTDISEGGLRCIFRPASELGVRVPYPRPGQRLRLTLDLYSDEVTAEVEFIRRRTRAGQLHEWSLSFLELPESVKDLIRSHVFTALRNARARGLF